MKILAFMFMTIAMLTITSYFSQQAKAVKTFAITIDRVNGYPPSSLPPYLTGAIHLIGSANSTDYPGQLSQYQVQVNWGDGTIDNNSTVNFTQLDLDGDGRTDDFKGTWTSNPDHYYNYSGTYTITVKLYHQNVPGAESSGDIVYTTTVSITAGITFYETGADTDFTGTILTVDGTDNYSVNDFPVTYNWLTGTEHTFAYASPLVVAANNKQYAWTSTTGLATNQSGTITVTSEGGTVTGNYKTQYHMTFTQNGLDNTAAGTVLTIDSTTKTYGDFDVSGWFDSGTTYSYEATVSSGPGKRFVLTGVTGPASPIEASGTVTGNYKTQYQISFAVNPTAAGTTNPAGTNIWINAGSLPIQATPSANYTFSSWSADTAAITFTSANSASTTATINGPSTITANFETATVQITVTSNPTGANFVKVDSVTYATPHTFTWTIGSTHTLEALSPVSAGTGTQYVWTSWSDGKAQTHSITVPNAPETVTANFATQHQLTVQTSGLSSATYQTNVKLGESTVATIYDGSTFTQWFDANDPTGTIGVNATISGDTGTQFVFTKWNEDSSTSNPHVSMTMNGPKTLTAVYNTQYQVTFKQTGSAVAPKVTYHIESGMDIQSTAQFSVWVNNGQQMTYSYESPVAGAAGTQYVLADTSSTSPQTVNSALDITGNYKTQYHVTFTKTGLDGTSTGTVLTVDAVTKTEAQLPYSDWCDSTASYSYTATVPSSISGKRFILTSVTGTFGPDGTVTGNYHIEYQMTFAQTGLDNDATGTVVTINGNTKVKGDLPLTDWFDSGTTYSYEVTVLGEPSKRFVLTGVTGPASPIGASGTVTGNYKTQYQVSFTANPAGKGTTNPAGTNIWTDSGPLSIQATPSTNYTFSWWSTDTASITFANNTEASTTARIYGAGTIIANFQLATVQITVTSSPTGLGFVKVDGTAYATPQTFTWTIGSTHTLEALSPVSAGTGMQYVWTSWSDGKAQTHSITVPNSSTAYTANFKTQFQVTFDETGIDTDWTGTVITINGADYNRGKVSFWVDDGNTITFSYASPLTLNGKRYVLTSVNATSAITISDTTTVIGNYKTQYYLTVSSAYDTPGGEGWYDTGLTAYATLADGTVSNGVGTQHIFTSWGTDASGTNHAKSNGITMDGPKTATANWNTQYYLAVTSAYDTPGGAGWYDAGSTAYATLTDGAVSDKAGTRHVFTAWGGDASGTGLTSDAITMNAPKKAVANWKGQYYLAVNNGGHGTVGGEGWYDENTIAYATISPLTVIEPFGTQYVFNGWTVDATGSGSPSNSILMNAAKTANATWTTQHFVTFTETGLDSSATGIVVTVNGATKTYDAFPFTIWVDNGASVSYSYTSTLSSSISDKRFDLVSVTGPSSPITVTGAITVTGNYNIMYYLHVISQYGNPTGSGWYPINSNARFSVTTPVDQGNQTLRVFIGWSGDASASTPTGSITMTKPSSVTAAWQAQYLVTFNTTVAGVVLSVPNVPETLPAGSDFFGTYYAANSLVAVGPAPDVVSSENGVRYVLSGWTLDGELFTTGANISFVADAPHQASVVYRVESLLVINAAGVSDHFTAYVTIAASEPVMRELSPTSSIQRWIAQGADTALSISKPNKIGHGEWAIFQQWGGQVQGAETSISFAMLNPTTVNAVFFQVNPVAASIPYSIIAALVAMLLSMYIERRQKTEGKQKLRAITWGTLALATALIVAATVSAIVAIGYSINVAELLDFTNWAIVFVAVEATVFLLATIGLTKKIQSRKLQ
jgi:hypothetical protein